MGGGSFGMSKSRSGSTATEESSGYGYNDSTSSQTSTGISESTSGGQSTSTQDVFASDIFAKLFGNASNAAGKAVMSAGDLTTAAQQLFTGGTQFIQGLGNNAETDYLTKRLDGNPQLETQISQLGTDISDFYSKNVNPRIQANAVSGGTLGGGRQGVAEGEAAAAMLKQFTEGATNLRAADLASTDAAATGLGQVRSGQAQTALTNLGSLFGLDQAGATSELGIYKQLAEVLGGPTTLTNAQSTDFSQSTSAQIAEAFSRAFGENFSKSSGTSSSFGRSNAFNMSGYVGVGG